MKRKVMLLVTAVTALGVLGSCGGVVGPTSTSSSSSSSSSSTGPGPGPVVDKEMDSGTTSELLYVGVKFAEGENDGDVVGLVENGGKTTILAVHPGVAHLILPNKTTYTVSVYCTVLGGITKGVSLLRYEEQSGASSSFRSETKAKYTAGTQNKFKFDAQINYSSFSRNKEGIWEQDTQIGEVSDLLGYMKGDKKFTVTRKSGSLDDIAVFNAEDCTLSFKDAATKVSDGIELSISYSTSSSTSTVEQKVYVNDGYNVYTNSELKKYIEDDKIAGNINVLRNIKCVLQENQYYYRGKSFETAEKVPFNTNANEEARQFQGSVYYRYLTAESNRNPLVINGNYMQIDGSELPLHALKTSAQLGYKTYNAKGEEIYVPETDPIFIDKATNPQEGIFRLYDSSVGYWDVKAESEEAKVVFNDLEIKGNSNSAPDPKTPEEEWEEACRNLSKGQIAIETESVHSIVNNCIAEYAAYSTQVNFRSGKLTAKDSIFRNTWGPAICTYASNKLTFKNSKLANSGGPSIYLITSETVEGRDCTADVELDSKSDFENRVDPKSAWLTTYNLSGAVVAIKTMIESMMNNMGYSILIEDKFNFELFLQKPDEQQFTGHPVANVTVGDFTNYINQGKYAEYKELPESIVSSIYNSLESTIIKPLSLSDAQFGTALLGKITDAKWHSEITDQTQRTTAAYAYPDGAFADAIANMITATGKYGQILLDKNLTDLGIGEVSVLLSCQKNS